MNVLLTRLRDAFGIELLEKLQGGVLCINKPNGLLVEVTVPYDVLEWFVVAKDDAGTFWSEWADHYAVQGETKQQLVSEMSVALERAVTIFANSEIRVSRDQITSEKILELKIEGSWKRASLVWMTDGPEDHPCTRNSPLHALR